MAIRQFGHSKDEWSGRCVRPVSTTGTVFPKPISTIATTQVPIRPAGDGVVGRPLQRPIPVIPIAGCGGIRDARKGACGQFDPARFIDAMRQFGH